MIPGCCSTTGRNAVAYCSAASSAPTTRSGACVCTIVAPASMHASASFGVLLDGRRHVRVAAAARHAVERDLDHHGRRARFVMWVACHAVRTRITQLLGIEHPIVQAPMGFIARAQLASAVSNAGGLGIIETSSGQLGEVRDEIREDAGAHRQAVRGQHRAALRARREHRRLRRRERRVVRDDVGRRSHEVHEGAEGRRPHRVPRRAVACAAR